jgi:hypothetical protein
MPGRDIPTMIIPEAGTVAMKELVLKTGPISSGKID